MFDPEAPRYKIIACPSAYLANLQLDGKILSVCLCLPSSVLLVAGSLILYVCCNICTYVCLIWNIVYACILGYNETFGPVA